MSDTKDPTNNLVRVSYPDGIPINPVPWSVKNEMPNSNGPTDFKAYGSAGELVLHVVSYSPAVESAERAAFQSRLDRGELLRVEVAHFDDRPGEVLLPAARQEDEGMTIDQLNAAIGVRP